MMVNHAGHVFVGERIDGADTDFWQMPQGGIDDGEDLRRVGHRRHRACLELGLPVLALVLAACAMIGALSGADIDIYAYFVARRFGLAQYGSVFGALHGLGWIDTAAGITLFSAMFTRTGSYAPAQYLAIGLLLAAAAMLAPVRLPPLERESDALPLLDDPRIAEAELEQFP